MPGHSTKTQLIAFRIPTEVYNILQKRVDSKRSKHTTVNEAVKARTIYDSLRKHGR